MYEITVRRYIIISRAPLDKTFCLSGTGKCSRIAALVPRNPSLLRKGQTGRTYEREKEKEACEFLIFIVLRTGEIRPAKDPKSRLRLTLGEHASRARFLRTIFRCTWLVERESVARRPAERVFLTGNRRKQEQR